MFGGYEIVYRDTFINMFSIILQHVFTVASLVMNSLIVIFICNGRGKKIGNYRLLILCFAINDLIYTCIHYIVYPIPETSTDSFLLRAHGIVRSRFSASLYIGNYGTSFPLLSAHFVYRSLTLKWTSFPRHFPIFMASTIIITIVMFGMWLFVALFCFTSDEESMEITRPLIRGDESSYIVHSIDTEHLYVVATFWGNGTFHGPRWKSLGGAAIVISVLVTVYATITSLTSIRLQKQLFKCLVYQTVLPLITAYFPAAYGMFAPILGLSWPPISVLMPNLCVMHSFIDGWAVILTLTEYRKALLRLLCCRRGDILKTSVGSHATGLRTSIREGST